MVATLLTLVFLAALLGGIPVAFAMGWASVAALLYEGSSGLILIPTRMLSGIDSFVLLAVPLFILAGNLMDVGGISLRLTNLSRALVGHIRGGLAMAVVVSEMFFSGISGSTVADASAISSMDLPAMRRAGYAPDYSVAIVSAATAMGILIPPCIIMVVLGELMNLSVSALFVGGLIPACVLALTLFALIGYQARRRGFARDVRATWAQRGRALLDALIALGMPVIIFGGILLGITTPTEAAAVAVVYAFIVGVVIYREIDARRLWTILVDSASALTLFILGISSIFSFLLAAQHVPEAVARLILETSQSPWFFLAVSHLIFIVLGSVLEPIPAMIIFIPIFLPILEQLRIDALHYGILVTAASGIGMFLPPVGVGLIIVCTIGRVPVARAARPLLPFLVMLCVGLAILTAVPWLTTVLPRVLIRR